MDFHNIKRKIIESREPKSSLEDTTSKSNDLAKKLMSEVFDDNTIIESIKKNSPDEKITHQIIEHYKEVVSSREPTNNQTVLDILSKSKYQVENKYIFVLDNQPIAISKDYINNINNKDI